MPVHRKSRQRESAAKYRGGDLFQFRRTGVAGQRQLREGLEALRENRRGRLRIAAPFTTLYHLLPEAVAQYMSLFSRVELTLLDRPQSMVIDLVRSGDIDFGLILEKAAPRSLATLRWKKVETVVIAPPGHPLCALRRVSLRFGGCCSMNPFCLPWPAALIMVVGQEAPRCA